MLPLELTVLGTRAARPYPGEYTASAYLQCGGDRVLLDCGEGIQVQLATLGLSAVKLDAVCITHLHGDHVYGLPGLLTSLALAGRTKPLTLLGPPALATFVKTVLEASGAHLTYPLAYPTVSLTEPRAGVYHTRELSFATLPLRHRVPTVGFCVNTKSAGRRLRPGAVERYDISYRLIPALRRGEDVALPTGRTLANAAVTLAPHPTRSVAYLTDTAALDDYPADWPAPDLLVHDATFISEDAELAASTGHSTGAQAAAFAKTCDAGRLLLTHLSPRYERADLVLEDARGALADNRLLEATELAVQGQRYTA